mmetsp:Transcript_32557/g.93534  ORF Transcript_32557/g.93534 Transcript_32557/m.93534 type:complete len:234 (-) Transcript_32557:235-936(-)
MTSSATSQLDSSGSEGSGWGETSCSELRDEVSSGVVMWNTYPWLAMPRDARNFCLRSCLVPPAQTSASEAVLLAGLPGGTTAADAGVPEAAVEAVAAAMAAGAGDDARDPPASRSSLSSHVTNSQLPLLHMLLLLGSSDVAAATVAMGSASGCEPATQTAPPTLLLPVLSATTAGPWSTASASGPDKSNRNWPAVGSSTACGCGSGRNANSAAGTGMASSGGVAADGVDRATV